MNYATLFTRKTYSSEAIILQRRSFSEADRILTLFTKDHGKISVIAKGVRKLTSRKRGGIEIFSNIKFSAASGKSMDILTEVSVIDGYELIREDLRRVSLAYYFCEVINKVTREGEKHTTIYEILKKYFEELKISRNLKNLRFKFLHDVLVDLGFWPATQKMENADAILENIIERKMNSSRIGKKMLLNE